MLFLRSVIKPKFRYADFATKSGTSSWQSRGLVADTNHESPRHKSRRRLLWFVSQTLSPTFPVLSNRLNSIRATQTGLLQTCHGLCCKHLVRDFRDLCWRPSLKLHGFMICHRLCPPLFPRGSFSESRRNGIWALVWMLMLQSDGYGWWLPFCMLYWASSYSCQFLLHSIGLGFSLELGLRRATES